MQINEFYKRYIKIFTAAASTLFWLLLIFAFEKPKEGLLTVTAALIHESGHFLFTLIFLKRASTPYGVISGFRIKNEQLLPYRSQLLLYLSGPIMNLAAFAVSFLLPCAEFARDFALINLFTMLSNLLPVEGYDGFGALKTAASALGVEHLMYPILKWLSFVFTSLMALISLYFMYYLNGGYWIYVIFSISALSFIKKTLKSQN